MNTAIRFLVLLALITIVAPHYAIGEAGDIVFVGQVPEIRDFTTIGSTFGNHLASAQEAPRGGGLFIRYKDGSLRNLTQAAGYGTDGFQGSGAIAVRDPAVHWDGNKLLFSMVIGSPTRRYEVNHYNWQLYEMSGLRPNETPVVTIVPNQPIGFNNVMPTYGIDDKIIFVTDRPRNGATHLYPQRDEYESAPTNSGLWSLDPASGRTSLLDHAPSGAFHPIVDSFGRVIYTRWDHLQRDQQAGGLTEYGAFNFSDESSGATKIDSQAEVFPEPRSERERTQANLNLHTFNTFFPWQINDDGTDHETVNHIGRHELIGYFDRSFNDDRNLTEYYGQISRFNDHEIDNFFQIREDPRNAGMYFGIDAPEFSTHAAGQVISLTGNPNLTADRMKINWITSRETSNVSDNPNPAHTGLYRNPLPLSDGSLVAVHTPHHTPDRNLGTSENPIPLYQFRIKRLVQSGGTWSAGDALTGGILRNISYYDPDVLVTFSGNLWELQPVELVARSRPAQRRSHLQPPENSAFAAEGVDPETFRTFLRERNLALIVSRNITSRDAADVEQPFNIRVAGTTTQKIPKSGKVYDVKHLQLFQGDQIRGYGGVADPDRGRRILANPLHDALAYNVPNPTGPAGSVQIASDGSVAAIVPARRAMTWQMTDPQGEGVVRERLWLTFQPGEIRVCASCHGVNSKDQMGGTEPQNEPVALRLLLAVWKNAPQTPPDADPDPAPTPAPPADGNPDDSPGEDEDPTSFILSVFGNPKRSVYTPGILYPGKTGLIAVGGTLPGVANQRVKIVATINETACRQAVGEATTSASGSVSFIGKIPKISGRATIRFDLVQGEEILASANATLSVSKKSKKMKEKDQRKFCTGLTKLRGR